MKVLVNGGLGFLGSNLVDKLLEQEHQITIVDNLNSNAVGVDFYSNQYINKLCL